MKIYENPIMNISFFEAESVVTDSSVSGQTGFSQAQNAALGAVSNDNNKVFNVNLTF